MDGVAPTSRRWATIPNAVTAVRLALLPVYVFLAVWTRHWAVAAWLLAALGATDWVDGFLARRLHQVSEVGKIIDPVADRLLVMTAVVSIAVVGAVPWWFAALTLGREAVVSLVTLVLAALGAARIDVLWWGKASTFALMVAYPVFLLTCNPAGAALHPWQHDVRVVDWVIGGLGLAVAWIVLGGYVRPALTALRTGRDARRQN